MTSTPKSPAAPWTRAAQHAELACTGGKGEAAGWDPATFRPFHLP
jgi:hypothetical protein